MKNVASKVSTLLALVSTVAIQSVYADVAGEVSEVNPEDGSLTILIDTSEIVAVGEPVLAFAEVEGEVQQIAAGEIIAVSEGAYTAIFDSTDVDVGMSAIVKQTAPEHEADHLAAIPEDIHAVVDVVSNANLDTVAAIKACREAIAEYPNEARFYAQLGRALEVDGKPASAIHQFEKALELKEGYPVVLHNLAKLRFYGPEELRDFETARRYFTRSAELGFDASMPVIGTMYRDALGGDEDHAEAAKWFSVAAEKGNPFSQNALAECYENGWGLDEDVSKALLWYRSSAELNYVPAMRNLGRVFENGIGVEANPRRAFDWYSRAAEKDDVESQFKVGLAFLKGNGVVHSREYALEWLTKAADEGHANAMREIASFYFGAGDEKEDELSLAAAWYRKAANKGDIDAQFSLGSMFEKGQGLDRDKDQAIVWYRAAARQGHTESQKRLAKLKADW